MQRSRFMRRLNLTLAGVFFALGAAGAVLPLLPTVVFWIAAAVFYLRSDRRKAIWLFRRPVFGSMVEDFVRYGIMRRSAKIPALVGITLAGMIGLAALWNRPAIAAVQVSAILIGMAYVATRPEHGGRERQRVDPSAPAVVETVIAEKGDQHPGRA